MVNINGGKGHMVLLPPPSNLMCNLNYPNSCFIINIIIKFIKKKKNGDNLI